MLLSRKIVVKRVKRRGGIEQWSGCDCNSLGKEEGMGENWQFHLCMARSVHCK
jgi:hypothetical protein